MTRTTFLTTSAIATSPQASVHCKTVDTSCLPMDRSSIDPCQAAIKSAVFVSSIGPRGVERQWHQVGKHCNPTKHEAAHHHAPPIIAHFCLFQHILHLCRISSVHGPCCLFGWKADHSEGSCSSSRRSLHDAEGGLRVLLGAAESGLCTKLPHCPASCCRGCLGVPRRKCSR